MIFYHRLESVQVCVRRRLESIDEEYGAHDQPNVDSRPGKLGCKEVCFLIYIFLLQPQFLVKNIAILMLKFEILSQIAYSRVMNDKSFICSFGIGGMIN